MPLSAGAARARILRVETAVTALIGRFSKRASLLPSTTVNLLNAYSPAHPSPVAHGTLKAYQS